MMVDRELDLKARNVVTPAMEHEIQLGSGIAAAAIVLPRSPVREHARVWRSVLWIGLAGGAMLGFTILALEPYMRRAPLLGATSALGGVLFVLVGGLLWRRGSTRSGAIVAATGLLWITTWLMSYDTGVLPLVSALANALMYVLLGLGVLLHPSIAPMDGWGRAWCIGAAVSLVGGQAALTLMSRPEWAGYSRDVVWPHVVADRGLYDVVSVLAVGGYVLVGIGFAALMLRAARRMQGYERALLAPALVAGSLVAPLAIVLFVPNLSSPTLPVVEDVFGRQGLAILLVALGLASVELRRGVIAIRAIRFMLLRDETPTARVVREGLRQVLRDPELDIYFWLPGLGRYVDVDGNGRDAPSAARTSPALDDAGAREGPLAVLIGAFWLTHHLDLVRLTGRVAGSAVHAAGAQLELMHERDELRMARMRASDADSQARGRLAEQLHDSALQVLSGVAYELATIKGGLTDPHSREALSAAHDHLLMGTAAARSTIEGLREDDLADGMAAALAWRCRESTTPATASIASDPAMSPAAGRALYGALRECLANANRHARAASVRISVAVEDSWVVGTVDDDGVGGARIGTRGGLAVKAARVAALGGTMTVVSEPGGGTRVEVRLRCA
jgi:signal transduction histidine kinase